MKKAYNNMKRVANRFGGLQPFCRFHSKKSVLYNTSVDFFIPNGIVMANQSTVFLDYSFYVYVSVGAQALIIVRISTLLNPLDWRIIKFTIRGGDFCVCAVFFALVTDLWKLSEPCGIVSLQEKVRNPGN